MKKVLRRALYVGIAGFFGLAWYGSVSDEPEPPPPASEACLKAFEEAHNVDPMRDTWSDLYPALDACGSLEAWAYASAQYPDAVPNDYGAEFNVQALCLHDDVDHTEMRMCDFVEVTEERRQELLDEHLN
jgi:hypothetical protein